MSAVELLRAAASAMRERADAAAPGPWRLGVVFGTVVDDGIKQTIAEARYSWVAEHIASWDPVVALAVADWLDATANAAEGYGTTHVNDTGALAVARAYLGRDEP